MSNLDLPEKARIHLVGIGGAWMSGLAVVLTKLGHTVTGSDQSPAAVRIRLNGLGVEVFDGHDADNVNGADLVIATAAIPADNPEILQAQESGISVISRAEMMGRLMSGKFGIGVAGTHGKTTTTSMLAIILEAADLDPTVLIGGDLDILNGNARLGQSDFFLTEACEAFSSFHHLHPRMAIVTNIEAEHLDWHKSLEGVIASFQQFLSQIEPGGCAIVCSECPNVRAVMPKINARVITFGTIEEVDCRASDIHLDSAGSAFNVSIRGRRLGEFSLRVPGMHNVLNSLAAITAGIELEVDPEIIRDALSEFRGAGRRFETLGTARGVTVVDDYAHHPTEIRATLDAARTWNRRIVAVFQPHLFSRTESLAAGFAESLRAADEIVVTEIYASREKPKQGVSGSMIADLIKANGGRNVRFIADKDLIADELLPDLREEDMVIVMGAGDIRVAGEAILDRLKQ